MEARGRKVTCKSHYLLGGEQVALSFARRRAAKVPWWQSLPTWTDTYLVCRAFARCLWGDGLHTAAVFRELTWRGRQACG